MDDIMNNSCLRPASLMDHYDVDEDGMVHFGIPWRYEALRILFKAEWQKRGFYGSP